LIVTDQEK